MPRPAVTAVITALALTACESTTQPLTDGPDFARPPAPTGLPDLVVDAPTIESSWSLQTELIASDDCAAREGSVSPGSHRLLRFTVTTPNIGTGDVVVGDPRYHFYELNDGLFELATCHDHFHYRNYALYELVSLTTGATVHAAKPGFCLVDSQRWQPKAGKREFTQCGTVNTPGYQGLSARWADVYAASLPGQYFVLDEPANPVPPGEYVIRVTVNPAFTCTDADAFRPRDANGMCHNFAESMYVNNVSEVRVTIP